MIRTLKFAPRYDSANSKAIGYHATQQNATYSVAVDELNRGKTCPRIPVQASQLDENPGE